MRLFFCLLFLPLVAMQPRTPKVSNIYRKQRRMAALPTPQEQQLLASSTVNQLKEYNASK